MAFRLSVLLALIALSVAAPGAVAATTAVDGPSADLSANQVVSVAASPDGSAAVAYLKQVAGVTRVFVSRLSGETWSPPVQVDANLPAGFVSDAPSIGVARGGKTVVLFPSGTAAAKAVYSAIAPSAGAAFGAAQPAAGDPAYSIARLALAPSGDGYAIVRTQPAGNPDLYALRLQGTTWTPLGGAFPAGLLDATPANPVAEDDVHGMEVATTPDGGSATVVWTESTGIGQYQLYARRLTGSTVGPAVPATTPTDTLDGHARSDSASDMSAVGMDGSGRAWVAFRQGFTYATDKFRGLARSFDGTAFGPIQVTDGLGSAPAENVEYQSLAVNASGRALLATYRGTTNVAEGAALDGPSWGAAFPVSPGPADSPSRASTALSDTGAGLVAFRHSPGGGADPAVLGRVRDQAGTLGAAQTLSSAAFGTPGSPVDAAAADGFAVTAFVQGAAGAVRVVAATVPLPQPAATPTPPTGPAGAAPDTVAPALSGLRVTPSAFRTGARPGALRLAATRAPATIRLTLSEAATVRFAAERLLAGRRARNGRCQRPSRANRGRGRCVRRVVQGGTVPLALPAGASQVRFAGRLARALAPGRYRLNAIPSDAAGNRGVRREAPFQVLAPKRR